MKAQMKKVLAVILTGIMVSVTFQPIGAHAAEYTEQLESDAEWEGTEIEEAASEGLNYLYINKNYVDEQEAQDIIVSWGNDGSDAPYMSLQLENEKGQNTFVEGTRYENNTVLFSSVLPKGIY